MKITVLGSGTSTGVPVPGCPCDVCASTDPKNNRLRTSILVEDKTNILVDTSTDLRTQALKYGFTKIDAVLYTHEHADHVNGIDDLRSFNFINKCTIPLYASAQTAQQLEHNFFYAFNADPNYEGGAPPRLSLQTIEPLKEIIVAGIKVLPVQLMHGKLPILGFRFGDFAYLTDCNVVPEETKKALDGVKIIIIDGLRDRPHKTHFTQEQAVRELEALGPQKAYLTHITHDVDHEEGNRKIRALTSLDVELAYDGLVIEI